MQFVVVVSVAHCAGVCSAVGAHGWNINESFFGMACVVVSWCQYGDSFWGAVGNVSGAWSVWVVFGALLGPEATGPFCSNAGGHFWCFFCSCGRHSMTVSVPLLCGVVVVGVVDGVVV